MQPWSTTCHNETNFKGRVQNSPCFGKFVTQDVPSQIYEEMFHILVGNLTFFGKFLTQDASWKVHEQIPKILFYSSFVKNGHILPTGQWYAPSAVINDALIMPE